MRFNIEKFAKQTLKEIKGKEDSFHLGVRYILKEILILIKKL